MYSYTLYEHIGRVVFTHMEENEVKARILDVLVYACGSYSPRSQSRIIADL
jgi:hypothetical protein